MNITTTTTQRDFFRCINFVILIIEAQLYSADYTHTNTSLISCITTTNWNETNGLCCSV
jgi:hypothetical protein